MAWTIKLLEGAQRELARLDKREAHRIRDFLAERVAPLENPRLIGSALTGRLRGYWRYRVGDYRVVCRVEDSQLIVLVVQIGHRSKIYRRG